MSWKTLDDMDLAGKVVLTRVDLNVPMKDGVVTDDTRIRRIVPTIHDILAKGGKPVLLSHFGRPKGKVVPEMSMALVKDALEAVLERPVVFSADATTEAVAALPEGAVLMLENMRFHAGEEKNDAALAKTYAALGDVYCNDAFSVSHRAHVSTAGIADHLPAFAGRLMQEELSALESVLANPTPPVVAVVGGAKVSTKLELLGNLIKKMDMIVIGGGMANTFLAAQGINVGKSLCEYDMTDIAKEIMANASKYDCELILPVDVVVASEFAANAENKTVAADACPEDMMILDAGPESVKKIVSAFEKANALMWNGPLGAFEIAPFNAATDAAALKAAELTKAGDLVSVAGGGDTVSALNASGASAEFTYVSSAGGAFLEWLEGKTLPGVAALSK